MPLFFGTGYPVAFFSTAPLANLDGLKGGKWRSEAAPSVLVSKELWLGHVYVLAMNTDVWSGLAERDKDAIRRAADTSYRSLGSVMDRSFDAQLEELRTAGASVRVLTRDESRRWGTVTRYRDVQAAWAEDQKSKEIAGAGAALEKVTSIMDDMMR